MSQRFLPFVKMQGAGNDFVFIDRSQSGLTLTPSLAKKLLDRHFGIGGDQLLYLAKTNGKSKVDLKIYNSDGSMAEMCGNGVRAVAFYLKEFKGFNKDFVMMTKRGPIGIGLKKNKIEVNMGEPILEGKEIPVKASGPIVNHTLTAGGKKFTIQAVSMGNPHCIIYVPNVKTFPVEKYGPLIENHPFFPRRVNVEFVEKVSSSYVRVRVWERGAGETLACGTGACAVTVASARLGKTKRNLTVALPGGELSVRWGEDNNVYLSGPAEVSYEGKFLLNH